jgi:hypothetical protein
VRAVRIGAMALLCVSPIGIGVSFGLGAERWQGPLLWIVVIAVAVWLVAGTIYMGGVR